MVKKIIGWILIIWGLGGLLLNIIFVASGGLGELWLIGLNSIFCLLFVWAGYRLVRPVRRVTDGQVDSGIRFKKFD